jgi:hypothetical protein
LTPLSPQTGRGTSQIVVSSPKANIQFSGFLLVRQLGIGGHIIEDHHKTGITLSVSDLPRSIRFYRDGQAVDNRAYVTQNSLKQLAESIV